MVVASRTPTSRVRAGERAGVLVGGGQAQPVGQVDGDNRATVGNLAVGNEPQGHLVDVAAPDESVRIGVHQVVHRGQEARDE
jgi:hypothetical protein